MPAWTLRPEILLCPNIPKPLHEVNPRSILGQSWWDKTRKEAYARTNFRCAACGVHKDKAMFRSWIEGHELYSTDYQKGRLVYLETVGLCHACHNYIHDGRLQMLLDKGEVHQSKYVAIIQHGQRVLGEAGLKRATWQERDEKLQLDVAFGLVASWSEWRLVLNGKLYPPKFKTFDEWKANYAN